MKLEMLTFLFKKNRSFRYKNDGKKTKTKRSFLKKFFFKNDCFDKDCH